MNGTTHTIRRRLSGLALAASIAAVAVPAATAAPDPGDILGTGIVRSQTLNVQDLLQSAAQEHGTAGFGNPTQAVRVLKAARVLGPGLDTVEKRGPYGAYWIRKHEVALVQHQDRLVDDSFRDANVTAKRGSADPADQVNIRLPRADDPMFREIVQEAAQEHGAAGFGNGLDLSSLSWKPVSVDYSHLAQGDRP